MADMTREEAKKWVIDHLLGGEENYKTSIIDCDQYRALYLLLNCADELEAYENADLIERHEPIKKINESLITLQGEMSAKAITEFSLLVCRLADIPRFNPNEKGE